MLHPPGVGRSVALHDQHEGLVGELHVKLSFPVLAWLHTESIEEDVKASLAECCPELPGYPVCVPPPVRDEHATVGLG